MLLIINLTIINVDLLAVKNTFPVNIYACAGQRRISIALYISICPLVSTFVASIIHASSWQRRGAFLCDFAIATLPCFALYISICLCYLPGEEREATSLHFRGGEGGYISISLYFVLTARTASQPTTASCPREDWSRPGVA